MTLKRFGYYVLLADMRTGSNLFEDTISRYDAFSCYGELFNPHFVGGPKKPTIPSLTLSERDADPIAIISRMRAENPNTLPGFRLFSDHDPLILEHCLADEACAKITLTRNPLESYVSHLIAAQTGQWQLRELNKRKDDTKVVFNIDKFQLYLESKLAHAALIRSRLQQTGQAAFHLTYDDMAMIETFNGVARYLGSDQKLDKIPSGTKRQNPASLRDKVENFDEMQQGLRGLTLFEGDTNTFIEPSKTRRSTVLHAGRTAPILYCPITFNPSDPIIKWMQKIEQDQKPAQTKMTGREIQDWLTTTPDRAVITCLEHPVERVYRALNDRIIFLPSDKNRWIRRILSDQYKMVIPEWGDNVHPTKRELAKAEYNIDTHRQNFVNFLGFIKGNLCGQTHAPVSPEWGSQHLAVEQYHHWTVPTFVIMPDMREQIFKVIEDMYDLPSGFDHSADVETDLFPLAQIYTARIEQSVRIAYQNDYRKFGFQTWKPKT
tara:strand:+ start:9245 stop:10717 length:1473 start_codon:yes stop_codon:yes gene_type:complete